MSKFKQVLPENAPELLELDAGLLLNSFDPKTGVIDKANIIGMTSGGITITCIPQITKLFEDVDGGKPDIVGGHLITHYECGIETSMVSSSLKLSLGYAVKDESFTDGEKYTPQEGIIPASAYTDVWVVGRKGSADGWAVNLKNAFSSEGYSKQTTDKNKGTTDIVLTGTYDINDINTVPMDFYQLTTAVAPASQSIKEGE